MKYALLINASPFGPGQRAALAFAQALHRRGHSLTRVFFYGEGVLTANRLQQPPQGEVQTYRQWQALATTTGCELVVCIAAALRRGIVDQREAERYELSEHNLAEGFTLSGLGQLVEAGVENDRLITFG
ncbi:sulfurtransferase complex subunit TusD [Simiduia agarivorans]|uniref:DsrE protein n=1 Tax=Simiduia agarivorans (strain DSM 21679 / JCM 13881 / BCRC 17597 / SA1) TaxID=1117647 RepID=K4KG54_SIMAS|nr:sulfurtransferase complex subunit TusD [Simiduia agarivorans]AFU97951.1 dsrE protein [Simiduia agarivorans SA1 = DSM 21679]